MRKRAFSRRALFCRGRHGWIAALALINICAMLAILNKVSHRTLSCILPETIKPYLAEIGLYGYYVRSSEGNPYNDHIHGLAYLDRHGTESPHGQWFECSKKHSFIAIRYWGGNFEGSMINVYGGYLDRYQNVQQDMLEGYDLAFYEYNYEAYSLKELFIRIPNGFNRHMIEWYKGTRVKHYAFYQNGEKCGPELFWDREGTVESLKWYEQGVEVSEQEYGKKHGPRLSIPSTDTLNRISTLKRFPCTLSEFDEEALLESIAQFYEKVSRMIEESMEDVQMKKTEAPCFLTAPPASLP